ncbi:hypothetical protein Scani_24990 [Streptomyces caniferus]|uniref:Uncharacterized protein n=1 Tax=Streptomyces caniferus TaxID=285557 RepID=A0A640S742_9ACTN|nr:hypothetical protein Scani_24990 [Streptomyces caniferus]
MAEPPVTAWVPGGPRRLVRENHFPTDPPDRRSGPRDTPNGLPRQFCCRTSPTARIDAQGRAVQYRFEHLHLERAFQGGDFLAALETAGEEVGGPTARDRGRAAPAPWPGFGSSARRSGPMHER